MDFSTSIAVFLVSKVQPAAQIVREIADDAKSALRRLAGNRRKFREFFWSP
jgi:hypothetical protein